MPKAEKSLSQAILKQLAKYEAQEDQLKKDIYDAQKAGKACNAQVKKLSFVRAVMARLKE